MQPIALQGKITPFDPMGAMQQGIQLGQMGLQTQKMQQDLIRQKLEEERLRQTIGTESIAQQEAARALAQRQREDASRKLISEAAQKFQKKDAQGRMVRDYEAEYQYLAGLGTLEPALLEDHRQKVLQNRSSAIKTESDANSVLGKQIIDDARVISGMKDNARAGQYLQRTTQDVARATGLPLETVQERYATVLNMGRPDADLISNSRGILAAQDISELSERELAARGLSREDIDPKGKTSVAAREFLISKGMKVPADMSLPQMRQIPEWNALIEANKEQILSDIVPVSVKAGGLTEASEAKVALRVYDNARAAAAQLKKEYGSRLGSMAQSAIATLVKQDPRYAALNDAINDYNTRNKTDISISKDGLEPVLERLLRQQDTLVTAQREGAKRAQARSFTTAGEEKAPTTPPKAPAGTVMMIHPRHKGGPVAIPASEVSEAKAAGWREQ